MIQARYLTTDEILERLEAAEARGPAGEPSPALVPWWVLAVVFVAVTLVVAAILGALELPDFLAVADKYIW
jgi:hypothetical protein